MAGTHSVRPACPTKPSCHRRPNRIPGLHRYCPPDPDSRASSDTAERKTTNREQCVRVADALLCDVGEEAGEIPSPSTLICAMICAADMVQMDPEWLAAGHGREAPSMKRVLALPPDSPIPPSILVPRTLSSITESASLGAPHSSRSTVFQRHRMAPASSQDSSCGRVQPGTPTSYSSSRNTQRSTSSPGTYQSRSGTRWKPGDS